MSKTYHTSDNKLITLGKPINGESEGLEGIVYKSSIPGQLVKIFKDTVDIKLKERKIINMLSRPPLGSPQNKADGQTYIAWPTAAVYENGVFVGYTMPEFSNAKSLTLLKNPQKRKANFPNADKLLPYVAAANLSAIVHNLHAADYIIGDFSPNNFLVDLEGVVYTIDTDSFQMSNSVDGKILPCEAGTPDYFPKEYLLAVARQTPPVFSKEGDLFSLAKLIFQLLMNGFDAHTGRPGKFVSSVNIDQYCVVNDIFVYQNNFGFSPPKKAPEISSLPESVADAFRACFITGSSTPSARPNAKQWETLLDNYYMSSNNVSEIPMVSLDSIKDVSIKRLPCILCLDTSGSMLENNAIGALNNGVATLINTLRADRKAQAVVDLSIITFGGKPEPLCDFTSILDIDIPLIEAVDGFTPFYGALDMSLKKMQKRIDFCTENGIALRPPLVIIMTDGKPLDSERKSALIEQINNIRYRRNMDIVAVGIGNDYLESALDEICTDNWPRRIGMKQSPITIPSAPAAAGTIGQRIASLFRSSEPVNSVSVPSANEHSPFRHIRLERNAQDFINFFKLMSSNVAGKIK